MGDRTSGDRGSTFQREPELTQDDADSHEAKKYRPTEGSAENFPVSTSTAIIPVVGDSSDAVDTSRPTDEDILLQQNIIRAEEAEKRPFVGDVEPIAELKAEYENGSSVFVQKIDSLKQQYSSIRRTRGDGNCFFRSFVFGYLEGILNRKDTGERDVLIARLQAWKGKLVEAGFQELVFEDAMEMLLDQVQSIGRPENPLEADVLVANFRDDTVSNMVVMLLRMITSAEIQRRQDHFAPFVMGMHEDCVGVEEFCRRYVECMGEESDHIHIVALTDALLVPIRVVYLDSTAHPGGADGGLDVTKHDFVPEGQEGRAPLVHVLYRPGHYDLVYPL